MKRWKEQWLIMIAALIIMKGMYLMTSISNNNYYLNKNLKKLIKKWQKPTLSNSNRKIPKIKKTFKLKKTQVKLLPIRSRQITDARTD